MMLERRLALDMPAERAWQALSGLAGVAADLPGAALTGGEEGLHHGTLSLDGVRCTATLRTTGVDEDEHSVSVGFHGREADGPAIAAGTLEGQLLPDGVLLTVRVDVGGQRASEERVLRAAERLLDELAAALERHARAEPPRRAQWVVGGAAAVALVVLALLLRRRHR